jgi:hypothetical protein
MNFGVYVSGAVFEATFVFKHRPASETPKFIVIHPEFNVPFRQTGMLVLRS